MYVYIWFNIKNFPGFCSLGPAIVTPDEVFIIFKYGEWCTQCSDIFVLREGEMKTNFN